MRTYVERTSYSSSLVVDINPLKFQLYKKPLVIVAREGQKTRLLKWANGPGQYLSGECKFSLKALGWWELKDEGYLSDNGSIVVSEFRKHDSVFFMDPERVYQPASRAYNGLIHFLSTL